MNNVNKIKIDNLGTSDGVICELSEELHELKDKLALTEKALELACEDMECNCCPLDVTICDSWRGVEDECAKAIAKCYLEEAKEMMKSE